MRGTCFQVIQRATIGFCFKKMSMALHVLPVVVAKIILLSHLGIPYHFNRCVLLVWWGVGKTNGGEQPKGNLGQAVYPFKPTWMSQEVSKWLVKFSKWVI